MSFDTSRYTFKPARNYNGVVMEQGRVQSDADWNEWLAELSRRFQAGTLDTLGRAVYPMTTPFAFKLDFNAAGSLTIGPGRMYVDGLLAENFGDPATATWDPALAEISNAPQPPPGSEIGAISFAAQPYYSPAGANASIPTSGTYLAYLDVWTRAVDYLQDPALIDSAINVDTAGRLQTVWQVQLAAITAGATCANAGNPWPAPSAGRLTTAPVSSTPAGPCCLTNNTGYTGRENQHYRVEVHTPGPLGTATIVWSRDNASVETGVTAITPVTNSVLVAASQLSVLSMGRDQVLGFHPGDWIEILDNDLELAGLPGELHRIDTIDFASRTITLDSSVNAANFPVSGTGYQTDPDRCTHIRRWDQSGKVYASDGTILITDLGASGSTGDIPLPAAGTAFILESGITVAFSTLSGGVLNTGDFWTFAARTDGTIEIFNQAPPRGIHHHYIPLAVIDFTAGKVNSDCRVPWNPGNGNDDCTCCCTVTVGDGINSVGQYTSINAALNALPPQGGEVCILPGRYFEHVFVISFSNVVIRGCGYQTRLASPSFSPVILERLNRSSITGTSSTTAGTLGSNPDGTFNAVISISRSRHIKLLSFAVEADDGEVGILIDGTGQLIVNPNTGTTGTTPPAGTVEVRSAKSNSLEAFYAPIVYDISILDLFLTASTLPAILARRVELLRIDDNRVLMANTRSLWPSVYVSGIEMHLDRNYVGIQSPATMLEWLPTTVVDDLSGSSFIVRSATSGQPAPSGTASSAGTHNSTSTSDLKFVEILNLNLGSSIPIANHPGGILIAGPSREVFVSDNLVEGGRFNGITLGSYAVVDSTGLETKRIIGIHTVPEDDCCNNGSLEPPGSSTTGDPGTSIVAGGKLLDIVIDRNRILNMGLCGIGPVGVFDIRQSLEVISIENLLITNNSIRDTVLRAVAALDTFGTRQVEEAANPIDGSATGSISGAAADFASPATLSSIGTLGNGSSNPYAAICVPDVQNLTIHDNEITNFGANPGVAGNGIFVLNGEVVDISRNRINETRDWTSSGLQDGPTSIALHGGIMLGLVTPALLPGSSAASNPYTTNIYEPGTPALRVEENVVRVALGQALVALGLGAFSIADNHFSCGGLVRGTRQREMAQNVLIYNLGAAIDSGLQGFRQAQATGGATVSPYAFSSGAASRGFMQSGTGTVLFANNVCQLEARVSHQLSFSSIMIMARDHLIFTGNESWVDSLVRDVFSDAILTGGSLNVTSNRFQESPLSVYLSGLTNGLMNVTSQNISTFCLVVEGPANFRVDRDNLALINMVLPGTCSNIRGK
ncbi:MAG TPA: DUF6519 domain-containing protein [Terracidiphilus sp.]|jgi:hypothetical protein